MNALPKTAVATLVTLIAVASLSGTAHAVPNSQRSCSVTPDNYNNLQTIYSDWGWQPVSGIAVSINNGTSPRNVVLQFNADTGVETDAEVRLGYSIDNGPVQFYGPQNFANHTQYWETRSNLSVATIGAGVHTIKPYWRVSGAAGKSATMDDRCFVAEGQTK